MITAQMQEAHAASLAIRERSTAHTVEAIFDATKGNARQRASVRRNALDLRRILAAL
jgi:hypothetical protein